MALPGGTLDPAIVDARMATLRRYYEGPVENRFRRPVHPAYHALEEEAGITWILEYFEP